MNSVFSLSLKRDFARLEAPVLEAIDRRSACPNVHLLPGQRAHLAQLQQTERFRDRKIATQLEKAGQFYEAENYHQDYHAKHGGSCPTPPND